MRRGAVSLIAALLALAVAPAAAMASLASEPSNQVVYQAQAGETNNLSVELSGANYILTDPGATITPTAPCAAITAHQVSCPAAGVTAMTVTLGDLNDTAAIGPSVPDGPFIFLLGEAGNDTLTNGSATFSQQIGGPGNDTGTGGPGADSFVDDDGTDAYAGGPGTDFFSMGGVPGGADSIDGGEGGLDQISYGSRVNPMSITLDGNADDGEGCPGATCEGDNVMPSVEEVFSGSGDDVLVGTPADEVFNSGDGNDTIVAGGGDDSAGGSDGNDTVLGGDGVDDLSGNEGSDTVDGGPGDDTFSAEYDDSGSDTLVGGSGLDSVDGPGSRAIAVSLDGVADDRVVDPGASFPPDNVGADIENVAGGDNGDVLIGNDAANELEGGAGNDTLVGLGGSDGLSGSDGDDTLDGGADPDTLDGAEGVDLLKSRDNGPDQLDCGSSADTVIGDSFDLAPASCENFSAGVLIGKAKAKKKKVKLELTCPAVEGAACPVAAKLSFKGDKVAAGSGTIAAGQTQNLKLKLKKAGRELLATHDKPKVDAKVTYTDPAGAVLVTSAKVVLG
jgi:Ca2+-binding RTX toxin-like protein